MYSNDIQIYILPYGEWDYKIIVYKRLRRKPPSEGESPGLKSSLPHLTIGLECTTRKASPLTIIEYTIRMGSPLTRYRVKVTGAFERIARAKKTTGPRKESHGRGFR
jgi:hypothetical protein